MTWLHLMKGCTLFVIEQALPISSILMVFFFDIDLVLIVFCTNLIIEHFVYLSSTLLRLMTVTVFSFNIDLVLIVFYVQ